MEMYNLIELLILRAKIQEIKIRVMMVIIMVTNDDDEVKDYEFITISIIIVK